MIPAILSAAFVIYLYKTLNQSPVSDTTGAAVTLDDSDVEIISGRLARLQARVEQLTNTTGTGESNR